MTIENASPARYSLAGLALSGTYRLSIAKPGFSTATPVALQLRANEAATVNVFWSRKVFAPKSTSSERWMACGRILLNWKRGSIAAASLACAQERIVTVGTSLTETVFALGAGASLVATDNSSRD